METCGQCPHRYHARKADGIGRRWCKPSRPQNGRALMGKKPQTNTRGGGQTAAELEVIMTKDEKRRELRRKLEIAKREFYRICDPDNTEYDNLPDEIFFKMEDKARAELDHIQEALIDLDTRTIRPNEWYKDFLASFPVGEYHLTDRQAAKFREKCDIDYRGNGAFKFNGNIYSLQYNGRLLTVRKEVK